MQVNRYIIYMIRRTLFILFLFLISVPTEAKFTGPFRGTLLPATANAEVGKVVSLTLSLETTEKFGKVEVTVKLARGLELTQGKEISVIKNFVPGEKKKFYYKVCVKEKGEQQVTIGVKARGLSKGFGLGTAFVSFINPIIKDNGTHTIDSDGTRVIVK